MDLGGGNLWAPFVVGPDGIPVITDVDRAIQEPQLAVLSAMAHGRGDVDTALTVASTALKAISSLDDSMQVLYSLVIESSLGEATGKALEMRPETMQQFFTNVTGRPLLKVKPRARQKLCSVSGPAAVST